MQYQVKKQQKINQWRQNNQPFYDFIYENFLDWPCTSVQWGPILQQNSQYTQQRVYFSCRTDGIYTQQDKSWQHTPNYIVMANVEIPNEDHYFINDLKTLFNFEAAKKHPNIKVKQIITHPGQVTVIRSSASNRKLLASKSDTNAVYLWTSDKYKVGPMNNGANCPDYTLLTSKSDKSNYALRFAPSLPRIISASGNKLEVFDIDSPPMKRQLGSVLSTNTIRPMVTLQGHDGVQDITFKTNEICLSAGQDRQVGIWDLRTGLMNQKIKDIHANDINAVSIKQNYIITGGQQGRINIIDDRTYKVVHTFQKQQPIYSIQFNPVSSYFSVGTDVLGLYSLTQILETQKFQPLFSHQGMRGHINQFDWNTECPNSIIATSQQFQHQQTYHGGLIHIYRPIDLFFQSKQHAIKNLQIAYNKLKPEQKKVYDSLI